jgi:hypothetical protein
MPQPTLPQLSLPRLTLPRVHPGQLVERARAAILAYYASHERAWEAAMSGAAIGFALLGFATDRVSGLLRGGLTLLMLAITVVFVAEYAVRALAARDRRQWVRGHLLELVALVPWLRPVRAGRLLWIVWLRAAVDRIRNWRTRPPLVQPNARRSRLAIAWVVLLVVSAAAIVGYLGGVDAPDSQARFAVVVMLLCVFSGLTAALATAFAAAGMGATDVPSRLRILNQLNDEHLISQDEYVLHRAALMQTLSPAPTGAHAGYTASASDRAAQASGAS